MVGDGGLFDRKGGFKLTHANAPAGGAQERKDLQADRVGKGLQLPGKGLDPVGRDLPAAATRLSRGGCLRHRPQYTSSY